jgi:hypothetical protein
MRTQPVLDETLAMHTPLALHRRFWNVRACSICLSVLDGKEWVEAETFIRKHRSFERQTPPRLTPALCDDCEASIARRRATPSDLLVA